MPNRPKDFSTEATDPADDDFTILDGATNSTRKFKVGKWVSGRTNALAPRGGVISAIGSSTPGTTQDNAGLAFGTGDLSFGMWVRLPDWTPATVAQLFGKYTSVLGVRAYVINATGVLRLDLGTGSGFTSYSSSVGTGLADGAWAFIAVTLDRDGNATFYVNGDQLGAPVSIAAQSAQTLTSTAVVEWFAVRPDGGTLGETFIVAGLLTATQIADIARAGNIAPFCSYTANTTTGQNTATIGGLSFYQWADFGQGYGPIIRDRSGNNQHALMGTTGLTHAVPRNPPGLPRRAPLAALDFTGETNTNAASNLATQVPSTGDLTLLSDFDWSGSNIEWGGVRSAANTFEAAQVIRVVSSGATGLLVRLYGATTSDFNAWTCANLLTLMAGKRGALAMSRSSSGNASFFLLVDGDAHNITNLGVFSTGGTPPTWQGSVAGPFLAWAPRAACRLYDLRLANVAMTEAQLRTEYERGEPGAEWVRFASKTNKLTNGDFASATGWTLESGWAVSGGQLVGTTTSGSAYQAVSFSPAQQVKITFTIATITAGTGVRPYIQFGGGAPVLGTTRTAPGTYTETLTAAGTGASTSFASLLGVGGFSGTVDDAIVEVLGYTARLNTASAAGLTALNDAKSATNDSTDFVLSTTGVTTSPDGRRQTIRATTNTSGNQQLLGASVIDTTKKWRIAAWSITSSGTPTVSLGNASAGTQYDSATVLVSGQNEIALDTRIPATANLWCNSNSTATLEHVVVLERAD